ncbi:MAG TPA: carboxypeptidase-like regulatory domain-containing protein [Terriglobia bacterium]|nr:carboxypeptidase-like regulatory domain-containing protein [Terriglobia bacterium]
MTIRLATLTAILLLFFSTARAQDTATIVGTVTDSTGAVVPGVRITVSNLDKGLTRDLVSNEAGEYVAAALPIGDYSITAEAPGFRKLVRSGVTLEVDQKLRVDSEPGMFGYMGRNPLTGPGVNNWDLALVKDFAAPWFLGEKSTLQFRWETFNTFNHAQFQGVNIGCGGLTPAGAPCSGPNNIGNGEIAGARSPRIMQLALKLLF